jgi:cytochrome c-type biogenesis protein CcmH/NrfG
MQAAIEQDNLDATIQALEVLQESMQEDLVLDEGQCLSLLSFASLRSSKQMALKAWQILSNSLSAKKSTVSSERRTIQRVRL